MIVRQNDEDFVDVILLYKEVSKLKSLFHQTFYVTISSSAVSTNEQHNLSALIPAVTDTFFYFSTPSLLSFFFPPVIL
jgi:hypothetical protein